MTPVDGGDGPDHDGRVDQAGTQAERTSLAWGRSLVGIAGILGLLAVHAVQQPGEQRLTWGLILAAGLALAGSWPASHRRYRQMLAVMDRGEGPASPVMTAVAAVGVVAVCALALAVVLGVRTG